MGDCRYSPIPTPNLFFFLLYPFCSPIIPLFLISNKINHRFNYTIKSYCRYGADKKKGKRLKTIVVRHLIACQKESIFIRLWTHFRLEKLSTSLFIQLEIMCECDSSENTSQKQSSIKLPKKEKKFILNAMPESV